ncbi:DUF397 domain-containing protein [Kineosporia sp. NBRC 101731]|uniref:DUF397 domain-containing protein n=1 Tax=Kineosporia sp. NBRC 101731 TaxID=3032199 RepID=UPI00249FDB90|nr:DUF397 domain-containing protein [Kineosporia sp. NBRC 101731]GLY32547.1 hypothetical protein Kisp02_59120 [Kineosporia sp. NBRC 101731]
MTNYDDGGWVKATASSGSGECVEMRRTSESVQVRDSKLGENSPVQSLTPAGFATWLESAKSGELDSLSS